MNQLCYFELVEFLSYLGYMAITDFFYILMYFSNGIELKSNILFNLALGQMNQLFYFELSEFLSYLGYIILTTTIERPYYTPAPPEGVYTVLPLSVLPSVPRYFSSIFLSNYWWQKSDIWSQASYRYPISWEAFLDPSHSYFLFAGVS